MKRMILLMGLLFWSCEDDRNEEPLVENIQMFVNGTEIIAREYYESITTYGASEVQEDGSVKKIFVLHFQREDGRVTPEKEHYALIMYDNAGQDNGQPIDEKLYLGGTQMDSLLLQTTSGRITLEIVGLSDYTEFSQASIDKYEDGLVSASDYLGVFYPSGQTTDNGGKSIVVPPSHMMLRTLANNDNIAFPWFAPAGTRRGVVDNATAVGYIDTSSENLKVYLLRSQ